MNKKKATICSGMLYLILALVYFSLYFLTKEVLFNCVVPFICGLWNVEQAEKFYNWLLKGGD